ncbi:hypothetical protein D3OALGA1CA_1356 [Olavius algarvensis associated proteobacterium Delta 3]|nr:hypothetical protein D3OALGA1CA_1356 [Olavius algarvensis associated proteobacterium Delta 3]CAB5124354.1 hypothetical protein D3OALGB2SA_3181 [Olavius algarvensis associated proteobacterium Delta 3]
MKNITLSVIIVLIVVVPWAMAGQVYEWIDENGVKHFTNEPPPPGATVVGQDKEIQYDAEKDRQRKDSDEQFIQQQQQEQKKAAASAPKAADAPPAADVEVDNTVRGSEKGKTYHQRQIRKEQRIKQEVRNQGGRPAAKPAPARKSGPD